MTLSPVLSIADEQVDLGDWWNRSAKSYDPMPEKLLHHFEGSYSYAKGDGSMETENHNGNAEFVLRKNIFTSKTQYNMSKSESIQAMFPAVKTSIESKLFHQQLCVAISKNIDLVAAYWFDMDNLTYVDSRNAFYGGLSWQYAMKSPMLSGHIGTYGGYSDTSYTNDPILQVNAGDYDSSVAIITQDLNWVITDNISFSEDIFYIRMLEDSEYFYSTIKFSLNFSINKYLSLFTSYNIKYDKNPQIKEMDTLIKNTGYPGSICEKDTTISTGIKISF
jgi:hypothetical protein